MTPTNVVSLNFKTKEAMQEFFVACNVLVTFCFGHKVKNICSYNAQFIFRFL